MFYFLAVLYTPVTYWFYYLYVPYFL